MPKPTKGPRLGGGPAHERLLLANLAAALFTHQSIQTTETKAKRLRPLAERLITFAKRGDLHARRRVLSVIGDKEVVHVLFTEIAPQVADREGGYTRITKIGNRKGDNAPMAVIELVLEPVSPKAKRRSEPAGSTRKSTAAAVPATDLPAEVEVDETVAAETPEEAEDAAAALTANTDDAAEEADVTDQNSNPSDTSGDDSSTAAGSESPEEGQAAEAAAADAVVDDGDEKA